MKVLASTIIAATIALSATVASAQTTQKLTASKLSEYGLTYSLPTTTFDIVIESRFTKTAPGEFYNYARRNLGINDAIITPSQTADVVSVTVIERGVADPGNRWLVQFKSGSSPFMMLNQAGVPVAVNTEAADATPDVKIPVAVAASPTPLETPEARQAVTQEMIQSSSMTKRAELAAQRIFELRETRNELLSGQSDNTPPDGRAMKLVLDNLTAQEAALTAMFAGTTTTWTEVDRVSFTPDSTDVVNMVIARISPTEGIVPPNDLSGKPIYLSIKVLEQAKLPVNEKGETKKFPKGGMAYTIPGRALLSISYDGRTLWSKEYNVAQLGVTFALDPAIFTDKKAPAFATFDPTTGGILEVGTKSPSQQ